VDAREFSFEDAFGLLEEVVARLETGGLSVDEMVSQYEQGVALARLCREKLDAAQAKVILLSHDIEDAGDGFALVGDVEEL
jgi:exodeoxyribonuclease VII small subunit